MPANLYTAQSRSPAALRGVQPGYLFFYLEKLLRTCSRSRELERYKAKTSEDAEFTSCK